MARVLVKFLFLGLWQGSFALASVSSYVPYGGGTYVPVSLPSLTRGSDRIFVATVEGVLPPDASHGYQTVDFRIELVLKGPLSQGALLSINQSELLKNELVTGDRVLWFLAADGPDRYSVPFGFRSGDFRIDISQYASNQNGNRGLWFDDGSLWDTGECSRKRFLGLLNWSGTSNKTMLKYLRWADSPYLPQPLPLDFFTYAIVSCLDEPDYQQFYKSVMAPFRSAYRDEYRRRN